jgi:predicted RNA-binding protein YlqC (UPF0109 family)
VTENKFEPLNGAKSAVRLRGNGGIKYKIPEERYAAARAIYESTPGISLANVAAQVGVGYRALEVRSKKDGGWKKIHKDPPKDMIEAARVVAHQYLENLENCDQDVGVEEKKQLAQQKTTIELAVEVRAKVIERHQQELNAVRKLVYECIQPGGKGYGDQAKLAKITAETLQIIQTQERKAYGIPNTPEAEQQLTIIIDREKN